MRTALALSWIVCAVAQGADAPASPLTLRQAIHRSLGHNLGLAVSRLEAARSVDTLALAESAFDPRLSWRNRVGSARTLAEINAGTPALDTFTSDLGISQPFSWGGELSLGLGTARTWLDSNGIGGDQDVSAGASISYTQPLLKGGWQAVNLAPVVSARLGAGRSRLQFRSATLDLIRDTENAYWTLAANRSLVGLRQTSLRSAESLRDEVAEKRRLGAATIQEQLQAEAEVANQQVAVLGARQQADAADTRVRSLLGLDATADAPAEVAVEPMPAGPVEGIVDYRAWLGGVLAFDLDARAQQAAVDAAQVDVDAARRNDLPQLDLTVAGSANGATGTFNRLNPALNALPNEHSWEGSATLTLSFPLGFRDSEARLRQAERSRRQADLRLADLRQRLTFDARAAWRDLEAARARLTAASAALELQRKVYEGERARYTAGASDIPRVLQAQAALDGAQLAWVGATLDARVASARVARLDGTLLARHGFTWETAEQGAGAGVGATDPLPELQQP